MRAHSMAKKRKSIKEIAQEVDGLKRLSTDFGAWAKYDEELIGDLADTLVFISEKFEEDSEMIAAFLTIRNSEEKNRPKFAAVAGPAEHTLWVLSLFRMYQRILVKGERI